MTFLFVYIKLRDDQIIFNGIIYYLLNSTLPGASHFPIWRTDGVIITILLHVGLAGRPYPQATCKTQLSPAVLTLRIPVMCKAHASFRRMLSRELHVKTPISSIALVFTLSLSLSHNPYN